MACLRDRHTGREYPLAKRTTVVGRDPGCDIVLTSRFVSRHHAQITKGFFGYYIEDLHSSTGTFVNNQRLQKKTRVRNGDVIKIARVRDTDHGKPTKGPAIGETTKMTAETAAYIDAEGFRVGAEFVFVK